MLGGRAERKGGCGNTGSCCTSLMEGSSTTCVLQLSSSTKSLSLLSTCNRKCAFLSCISCFVNTCGAVHDLMPCAFMQDLKEGHCMSACTEETDADVQMQPKYSYGTHWMLCINGNSFHFMQRLPVASDSLSNCHLGTCNSHRSCRACFVLVCPPGTQRYPQM